MIVPAFVRSVPAALAKFAVASRAPHRIWAVLSPFFASSSVARAISPCENTVSAPSCFTFDWSAQNSSVVGARTAFTPLIVFSKSMKVLTAYHPTTAPTPVTTFVNVWADWVVLLILSHVLSTQSANDFKPADALSVSLIITFKEFSAILRKDYFFARFPFFSLSLFSIEPSVSITERVASYSNSVSSSICLGVHQNRSMSTKSERNWTASYSDSGIYADWVHDLLRMSLFVIRFIRSLYFFLHLQSPLIEAPQLFSLWLLRR